MAASAGALAANLAFCPNEVARLDPEFQDAVKTNDVAALNGLLSDDYVLV